MLKPLDAPLEPDEDDCCWLSAYLFFQGDIYTEACDRILLEVAAPFVRRCEAQGWITRHFFIRYSERGAHVRLRLHGKVSVLEETVKPALLRHVEAVFPVDPADDPLVHWAAYEPEVDRYGGPEGVALAEDFFWHSSDAALAFIDQLGSGNRPGRLGKGLLAMTVLLHAFLRDRAPAAALTHDYGTGYLKTLITDEDEQARWESAFERGFDRQAEQLINVVHTVWEHLEDGGALPDVLGRYYRDLLAIQTRFAALQQQGRLTGGGVPLESYAQSVGQIVPSYLHMMNNRLGVRIEEEWYLSYLITRALEQPVGHAAL